MDVNPIKLVQLAVDKNGPSSRNAVQRGRDDKDAGHPSSVDKETQRVAMRLGESEPFIAKPALQLWDQDERRCSFHFGKEKNGELFAGATGRTLKKMASEEDPRDE